MPIPNSPWNPHPGPNSSNVIEDIFREIIGESCMWQVLDLTYGNGTFWKWDGAPKPDYDPEWDFRSTELESGSVPIVVFDPPYSSMGTASDGSDMAGRYGSDRNQGGPKNYREVAKLLRGGIREACRVARQWVIVKTQDVVERSKLRDSTTLAINEVTNAGFDIVKEIAFMPHRRSQPSGRRVTGRGGRPSWFIVAMRHEY
jgi:hypothetical protein